ncbi:hypothetical protein [Pontivivens ytuae]|uniref:Uncharacterized protein n=1 Tax=Pontivivens ytuae TaxID=2789856 RepID=A0A7S9LR45_9RHOB|nr:hypothetical protein [Pontivivens ytuae]QPH53759.1 hypothetical protein I0K15_18580 [Pontivivens ytuae]
MFEQSDPVVAFRMAERLTLTAAVLLIALIVMIGFWRSVQKLDVDPSKGLGIGGSVVLSTPVFVLLTLVAYAYVSLSNPISVDPHAAEAPDQVASRDQPAFLGASRDAAPVEDDAYDRTIAQRRVRSLNCLAEGGSLSPRLEDDLADAKLMLMRPVWAGDWGAPDTFAAWARGQSTDAPNAAARAFYEERHVVC